MSFTAKLIFLDIDGVLNSVDWAKRCEERYPKKNPFDDFDPIAVAHLKALVELSKAEIVVSSTWRLLMPLAEIKGRLSEAGYSNAPVLSKTPALNRRIRGAEVMLWRERSKHTGPYVCIDDAEQFYPHQPMVRTTMEHGLTATLAAVACDILDNWDQYAKAEREIRAFEAQASNVRP